MNNLDQKRKKRFEWESGRYDPYGAPPNDWLFSEEEFVVPEKRL